MGTLVIGKRHRPAGVETREQPRKAGRPVTDHAAGGRANGRHRCVPDSVPVTSPVLLSMLTVAWSSYEEPEPFVTRATN